VNHKQREDLMGVSTCDDDNTRAAIGDDFL
jgi:hypothetical protein